MDRDLIEKYKSEMLRMYKGRNEAVAEKSDKIVTTDMAVGDDKANPTTDSSGKLIGVVTAIRSLYPVKNAKVTVFKGNTDNMQIIDVKNTDQSGRTDAFILPTPERSESLTPENDGIPYAEYNMMVEADGYLTNIHLNIPVFSGVTSVQPTNMTLLETAGVDKGPQIFDEAQNYNL